MVTPQVPTYPKHTHYRIQDPNTGRYARLEALPPAKPEPAEDTNGSISWSSSFVKFRPPQLASWWWARDEVESAFATYFGVAPLEIVRCEP